MANFESQPTNNSEHYPIKYLKFEKIISKKPE
jgi:hypothetical protein